MLVLCTGVMIFLSTPTAMDLQKIINNNINNGTWMRELQGFRIGGGHVDPVFVSELGKWNLIHIYRTRKHEQDGNLILSDR